MCQSHTESRWYTQIINSLRDYIQSYEWAIGEPQGTVTWDQ